MKKNLDLLVDNYDIKEVERHIFYNYLSNKSIKFRDSVLLNVYFQDFEINNNLLKSLSVLEINTFEKLEKSQELLIPKDDRKINGAFFTPRSIVEKIIYELKPQIDDKCADISCGCGSFLIGLLKYYIKEYKKPINEILRENIYGYDILDYNISRTKILIAIFALENGEIVTEDSLNLTICDSLENVWNIKFEIIVGNPPYVKFQDLNENLRKFLLDNFKSIEKGTYNLYFAFFELGYNLLDTNGKLGYITPNNFFTSLSGESLRNFFSSKKSIYKIIDFNSHKVFDVLTYTCLTFMHKKENDVIKFKKYFDGDFDLFVNSIDVNLSTIKYHSLNDKKWRLLLDQDQENIRIIENIGTKIGDLFTINVGIATLRDDLYYVSGIDGEGYFKVHNETKYYIEEGLIKSIYKISDFRDQNECDGNVRKIIFPYEINNNKAIIIDEIIMKSKYPKASMYFEKVKDELLARSKKEVLSPYYIYGRSQGLNKFGIRLLTPTFSSSPNFLKVVEKDSLYCNGYGVHFKEDQNNITLFDSLPIQSPSNIDVLQKILNSRLMDYYVKTTSVTISGGYPCYQKNFIQLFNIPYLTEDQLIYLNNFKGKEFDYELEKFYGLNLEL